MAKTGYARQIPIDVSGTIMPVTASMLLPSGTSGLVFAGIDDNNFVRYLKLDATGKPVVTGSLSINNQIFVTTTGSLPVFVGNFPSIQSVTGSVNVNNQLTVTTTGSLPVTLQGASSVGVNNFPVTQAVTGSVVVANQLVITTTGSIPVVLQGASVVSVTNFPTVQIITGSVQVSGITFPSSTNVTGSVALSEPITFKRPGSSTLSRLNAMTSSIVILSANSSRAAAILFNDSPFDALVAFAPTSSYADGFTYYFSAYSTLEFPHPVYTGIVSATWEQQSGSMRVTETNLHAYFWKSNQLYWCS